MKEITQRQREVLIGIYNLTQRKLPPTFAELRERLGVSSNQTVKDFIDTLSRKGYIRQENYKARGIVISEKGFEEISNSTKGIRFTLDYNPIAVQFLKDSHQGVNNSSNFLENTQEYDNTFLSINN